MVDYIPQDEYFEWEDILVYRQAEQYTRVEEMGREISTTQYQEILTQSLGAGRVAQNVDFQWSETETWAESQQDGTVSRSVSTTASWNTMHQKSTNSVDTVSYDHQTHTHGSFNEPRIKSLQFARDDSDAYLCPSSHVDYFSHPWTKEDISASWRHIRVREKLSNNVERLENVSWRLWTQMCFNLVTISPEIVNWLKDIDDTYLHGPFKADKPIEKKIFTSESHLAGDKFGTTKSILKRPSISTLLLQGSQLSWQGSRRTSSVSPKSNSTKRSVQFDEVVEQCITVRTPADLKIIKNQNARSKTEAATPEQSAVGRTQRGQDQDAKQFVSWNLPIFFQPPDNRPVPASSISEWTWLGSEKEEEEEEEELDWITSPPIFPSLAYAAPPKPTSIVRDIAAKSNYVLERRGGRLPLRDYASSDDEEEDEMMAQYLFDCDFRSDTDSLSPSDSSSSVGDQDDENVDFFDNGDFADEKRMMERLHEIPMMETMKQTLFEQVVDEVSLRWQ